MFKPGLYYRLLTSLATKGSDNSFLTPKVKRFILFIALKRMVAFCKKVVLGLRFGR